MKHIIASVCFDILFYTIGNNICTFKNFELKLIIITERVSEVSIPLQVVHVGALYV